MNGISQIPSKEDRLKAIRKLKGKNAATPTKGSARGTPERVTEEAPTTYNGYPVASKEALEYMKQVEKTNKEFWGQPAAK